MARIPSLPSLEIIKGFRGLLDFVEWRGIFYVRTWPKTPRAHLTPGTLAAGALFGQIVKAYSLLGSAVLVAFQQEATDQPRTSRDLYIQAVLGHMHEDPMSDITNLLEQIRDALQIIDDFADPNNLIFGYADTLSPASNVTATGTTTTINSASPPGGEIWCITHVSARDQQRQATYLEVALLEGGAIERWLSPALPSGASRILSLATNVILKTGDKIRLKLYGTQAGDLCTLWLHGYRMAVT